MQGSGEAYSRMLSMVQELPGFTKEMQEAGFSNIFSYLNSVNFNISCVGILEEEEIKI